MHRTRTRLSRLRPLIAVLPLLSASCAGLARDDRGNLQPQTVRGPCQVKKFFILGPTAVPAEMTVGNGGDACTVTLFNPDLQRVFNAVVVAPQPAHGRAAASLITLGRQVEVSYTPQPGYRGPDRFGVTIEPNGLSVTFVVTVQPDPPNPQHE